MAVFMDLPPELLESIYHGLESIDDVHHLGRTCKKTYTIIRRQEVYVDIMRTIIEHAPQHRYDLQLCEMLKLHGKITAHMRTHGTQLPVTQVPNGHLYNKWEVSLMSAIVPGSFVADISDPTVYEILARYQGLRVLQTLWLERQLQESDYVAVDSSSEAKDFVQAYQVLHSRDEQYKDGEIAARSWKTPETKHYNSLNADQKARFYAAVTNIWLLNEIRWVLTNFQYPARFGVQVQILDACTTHIKSKKATHLLDELDRLSVFRFLYHHLLPLYSAFLADRDSSKLPFTFPAKDFAQDPSHCSQLLQLFLLAGQTYFQPPDIIDLIVRSTTSRRLPYPLMTIPKATEQWQRPCPAFAFPRNFDLCDESYKGTFQRAALTHINVIVRSSFHQTQYTTSPQVTAPVVVGQIYAMSDHAGQYFVDRALVAFELYENKDKALIDIRNAFPERQGRMLWSVWWWANSEDKARAKMERWREAHSVAKPPPRL